MHTYIFAYLLNNYYFRLLFIYLKKRHDNKILITRAEKVCEPLDYIIVILIIDSNNLWRRIVGNRFILQPVAPHRLEETSYQ